ncbi:hypothetical protein E2C01_011090 [Portunus trituberculatus]|uniref:Uncharacterized protein n=1 Tax=Portunus trituberculatus TaxID=210409 RepID=A0A5B7DAC2_PORTR|nr:hypothetical protein [Portunus trituberculatus]
MHSSSRSNEGQPASHVLPEDLPQVMRNTIIYLDLHTFTLNSEEHEKSHKRKGEKKRRNVQA